MTAAGPRPAATNTTPLAEGTLPPIAGELPPIAGELPPTRGPGQPPSQSAPSGRSSKLRGRRGGIAAAALLIVLLAAATLAILLQQHRRPAARVASGSTTPTSYTTAPQLSSADSSSFGEQSRGDDSLPPGSYRIGGASRVSAYTGPSASAYSGIGTLSRGTAVRAICTAYGQRLPTSDQPDALWYWTDSGWINDFFINTGSRDPKAPQCSGSVPAPSTGSQPPSSSLGPFATIGHDVITVRDAPGNSSTMVTTLQTDTFVSIVCHASSDVVPAAPGGTTSGDWDELEPGQWIPDAYLLTGSSGSPAPPCP